MTVQELIAELSKLPQDTKIYFSNDEEGNVLHANAEVVMTMLDETAGVYAIYPQNDLENDIM